MSPRFGIAVPQSNVGADDLAAAGERFVRTAEDAGLDSLWVQEQLLGTDPSLEPVVHLAWVAAVTSRIRLGTAAVIAPVRNPIVLAKQLASLDRLSAGRLTVGVALGDMPALYSASGVPHLERAALLERFVTVARELWSGGVVTYSDAQVRLEHAAMSPSTVQQPHPPIWFGAHSERGVERAMRLGTGWVGAGGSTVESFARLAEHVRIARQAGAVGNGFTLAKKVYLHVDRDRERAREELLAWFREHWGGESGARLGQRVGVAGTVAEVANQLADVVRAGAEIIILNPVRDEQRQLDLLVEHVVPSTLEILGEQP